MVKKYRKKPVVIEAVEWRGDNLTDLSVFMQSGAFTHNSDKGLIIHTLEGDRFANIGDFIIKGVAGEFYPCKPDIFAQTYEEACPPQPPGAVGDPGNQSHPL